MSNFQVTSRNLGEYETTHESSKKMLSNQCIIVGASHEPVYNTKLQARHGYNEKLDFCRP